jgi:hypothetical protein
MTSNNPIKLSHTEACSFLPPLHDQQVIDASYSSVVRKTYVCRKPTRVTPSPSILLTHCSRKPMMWFLYIALSKRSFDSSTDQGGTTSVECPFAAGHLQNTVGLDNERGGRETTNVSSCSFRLMLGKKRQCPRVS